MKHLKLFVVFITPIFLQAQQSRWSLGVQAQPELTFYGSNYAFQWQPSNTKTTVNTGIAANVEYNAGVGFFAYAGLGYINRAFNTIAFLNQGALPPPWWSGTLELVTVHNIQYRTLYMPAGVGYTLISKKRFKGFVQAQVCGNFLLTADYPDAGRYGGTYAKNSWQGYSLSPGVGFKQASGKRVGFVFSASYSAVNKVVYDKYLFGQTTNQLALTYHFLQCSAGLQVGL